LRNGYVLTGLLG